MSTGNGDTLHVFEQDSGTASACTGACAVNWPPLRVHGTPLVGSGATNGGGINAFGGSWFAVSPAGDKVAPRAQPQAGGGYGGSY